MTSPGLSPVVLGRDPYLFVLSPSDIQSSFNRVFTLCLRTDMSTGVSPPTIPSIETGTPPKEWSESILTSSSPRDTPATILDPKANQGTPNVAEPSRGESHAAKEPQTAPSHLYPKIAKEEPHVSLPSTELRGAQPLEHTGGVGALPGNLSESSVALLPEEREERAEERLATSRQRRGTIKPSVGSGEEERKNFLVV
ncbi:hypothetical protein JVU11DRAFT_8681 [Chiua virens]|nr:hypothetical protein JVU11DRAFT_8681 [Chiua virens]